VSADAAVGPRRGSDKDLHSLPSSPSHLCPAANAALLHHSTVQGTVPGDLPALSVESCCRHSPSVPFPQPFLPPSAASTSHLPFISAPSRHKPTRYLGSCHLPPFRAVVQPNPLLPFLPPRPAHSAFERAKRRDNPSRRKSYADRRLELSGEVPQQSSRARFLRRSSFLVLPTSTFLSLFFRPASSKTSTHRFDGEKSAPSLAYRLFESRIHPALAFPLSFHRLTCFPLLSFQLLPGPCPTHSSTPSTPLHPLTPPPVPSLPSSTTPPRGRTNEEEQPEGIKVRFCHRYLTLGATLTSLHSRRTRQCVSLTFPRLRLLFSSTVDIPQAYHGER
jgi:hypothetical protein